MTPWELAIAGLLYLSAAYRLMPENPGMALTFAAYALANVGLMWAAKR
jgi:hypothetical protein